MKVKKQITLLIKFLFSGLILSYLFTIIPLNEIKESVLSTDIFLFIAAMLIAAPVNFLSALETQYLTRIQGINLSVWEILKIHLITNFYGLFLPGTLSGGAVKWYKFAKYGKKSSAAAVVVFNRFLETLMIVFIGTVFLFFAVYSPENEELLIILVLIFFLMILLYFLMLNKAVLDFIEKIFLILPLPAFIRESAGKFSRSMHQFRNLGLKDHFEIIGLLFLYHALGVISFFVFAKSLNIDLSIWVLGWIRSAMTLAIMLPLSFAGLGIREGTLVFLLGQYGIKPDISMALSFLFFSKNILTSLLGGFLEFKEFVLSKKIESKNILTTVRDKKGML